MTARLKQYIQQIDGLFGGIGTRLLFYVLLFSSAVTLILTAVQLFLEYRAGVFSLERNFEYVETTVIPSLAESIWKVDQRQIEVQLSGLLHVPDIQFVQLVEIDYQSTIMSFGESADRRVLVRDLPVRCKCSDSGEEVTLGSLRIEASLERIYDGLLQRVLFIFASQGIKTFLVSFFLLYVFHILVMRHVLAGVCAMECGKPIRLDRSIRPRKDEIDRFAEAFNGLLARQEAEHREKEEISAYRQSLLDHLPGWLVRLEYFPDGKKRVLSIDGDALINPLDSGVVKIEPDDLPQRYHPDDRDLLFKEVPRRLRENGFSEQRFRRLNPDGSFIWLSSRERVVERLPGGGFITEALVFDITEEMEARMAKERSERVFRDLVEALPVGVFMIDADGKIKIFNEAAVSIWGRRPELGSPYWSHTIWRRPDGSPLPHSDADWFLGHDGKPLSVEKSPMAQARAQNRPLKDIQLKIRHPDGAIVPVLAYPTPLYDADGAAIGALNVMVDMSAYKRMEAMLRLREREYRSLVENAPLLIVRYDTDLNRVFVNKAWEELAGVRAEQVEGAPKEGTDSTTLNTNDAYIEKLRVALETDKPQEIEFDWQTPGGKNLHLHYTMTRSLNESGEVDGVLSIGRDISERKQIEEERALMNARMEATRKWEALGQLAGGVAHDFNNLLGAIMGFARFIVEDSAPAGKTAGHGRQILAAGQRGKALVERILAFSKRDEMTRVVFSLNEAVRECLDILGVAIPSSVRISMQTTDEAFIRGDVDQIGEIVLNLAINASDALMGKAGEVSISIRSPALPAKVERILANAEAVAEPALWGGEDGTFYKVSGALDQDVPYIALTVEDRGTGMDESTMRRLFTPFFTTKAKGHGTGIGLTVIQSLVQSHDGAVVVKSRLGEGTSVNVLFPLVDGPREVKDIRQSQPLSEAGALFAMRILVIDDDVDFCDMLIAALERKGAEVAASNDPIEIIDALNEAPAPWHVLVTDHTMPGMTGIDVIRRAKVIRPDLPCILCSGFAKGLSEQEREDAGVDAFVRKPFDPEDLVKSILSLVPRS